MQKTYKITVSGLVQGVGFRPFVYNLAKQFFLTGTVSNNQEGVIIFISGLESNCSKFYNLLLKNPPPVAKIQESHFSEITFINFTNFSIVPSSKDAKVNLPLTPDFAICTECKNEINNKTNRRNNYAFTTCVNCGPRWAITRSFPFERLNTSIAEFKMCSTCLEEYQLPSNRRFHSQTNSCKTCGIQLELIDNLNSKVEIEDVNLFEKLATLLKNGAIVAIKNTSGFLLCCNAENKEVVEKLRAKKNRPNKPFAVLYPSLEFLKNEVILNANEIKSLQSTQRPITIISTNNYKGKIAINFVAPNLNQLGVMLPYTGILQLLALQLDFPIVATSGNIHGSPIISNNQEAIDKLKTVADYFLLHNLKIEHSQDDSVVKFSYKYVKEILFRRSRGYAPNYLNLEIKSSEKVMALGADLKSSIAFCPNNFLYISQYLGNLENFEVYNRFVETKNAFTTIFEVEPEVVLIDKHPGYFSSKFGKEIAASNLINLIEIQHHKAHFAAVLGEHQLFSERVLGVVFDGTGYGDDGNVWGGEFFEYQTNSIKRINHFEYFNWLLGNKMAQEPRLSLFSLLSEEMTYVVKNKFTQNELKNYKILKKTNTLKTSSVGRLFDAVASLLDICDYNSYEGEAAILLENQVETYNVNECKSYCLHFESEVISSTEIIKNIVFDIENGVEKEQIITNFIFTIATIIIKVAKKGNYQHIACSGGVFQNTTLVDMLIEIVPNEIKLYFHTNLSPNDENISFGQFMYYLNCIKQ